MLANNIKNYKELEYIVSNMENTNKYSYYFIHNAFTIENLIQILKDGKIKKGKFVKPKFRHMSGEETASNFIYGQIYFHDLENLTHFWGPSLIISPYVLDKQIVEFHRGWGSLPTLEEHILKPTDNAKQRNSKFSKIRKYLKNPKELPAMIRQSILYIHEVVFSRNISIKKYVIGITCNFADDKTMNKINKIINEKKYKLFVLRENSPMPLHRDII